MADLNLDRLVDQIFIFQNKIRTDPQSIIPILQDRLKHFEGLILQTPYNAPIKTRQGTKVVQETIAIIKQLKPLPAFKWSYSLHLAADDHATDAGQRGLIGHVGSNQLTMTQRVKSKCKYSGLISQNIEIGSKKAQQIVISLLIDDGLPTRFHRHNILSQKLQWVGIGVNPHINYQFITVITYAQKIDQHSEQIQYQQNQSICDFCMIF